MAVESASTDMMDIQIALNTEPRGKESILHTKTRVGTLYFIYVFLYQNTCSGNMDELVTKGHVVCAVHMHYSVCVSVI